MPLKTYIKKGIVKISASELSFYYRRMKVYQGLEYDDVIAAKKIYNNNKAKFIELGLNLDAWFEAVTRVCKSRRTHFNPIEFNQHFQAMAEMISSVEAAKPETLSDLEPLLQNNLKSLVKASAKLNYQASFADKNVGLNLLIAAGITVIPAILLVIPITLITGPVGWLLCVGVAAALFTVAAVLCIASLVAYAGGVSTRISKNLDRLSGNDPVKAALTTVFRNANVAVKNYEDCQIALYTIRIDRELRQSELEKIPTTDPDNQDREVYLQRFKKVCELNHLLRSAKEEISTNYIGEKYKTVLGLNPDEGKSHHKAVKKKRDNLKAQRSEISGEFQAHQRALTLKNPSSTPATLFAPTYALGRQKDSNEKYFFKPWKSGTARVLV